MLIAVAVMVFLVVFGLAISAAYFLVEAPASRKQVLRRVEAVRQSTNASVVTSEALVFRQDVLSQVPFLDRLLFDLPGVPRLRRFVQQSGVSIAVDRLLLMSLAIGVFAVAMGLVAGVPIVALVLVSILLALIPFAVIAMKRSRRIAKFEELFPDSMDLLARAVRAGHAFTTGLELIADEMPEPLAGEFRTTYDQQNLGLPLRDALQNLATRVPSPDVRIFVAALQIQRDSGGNLAEILDNLSFVVRERFKLYRQVRALTAEGRFSMYLLLALPPACLLAMSLLNPDYLSPLFHDPLGHQMLVAGAIMQILGYLVIRRIVRMKI